MGHLFGFTARKVTNSYFFPMEAVPIYKTPSKRDKEPSCRVKQFKHYSWSLAYGTRKFSYNCGRKAWSLGEVRPLKPEQLWLVTKLRLPLLQPRFVNISQRSDLFFYSARSSLCSTYSILLYQQMQVYNIVFRYTNIVVFMLLRIWN